LTRKGAQHEREHTKKDLGSRGSRCERLAVHSERLLRRGIADGQIVESIDPRVLAHVGVVAIQGIQLTSLLGQREVISEDARRWMKDYANSLRK